MRPVAIIAIGASWGGLRALRTVLALLPQDMPPIVVAQHRTVSPGPADLASLLDMGTALSVCEAEDKFPLEIGWVYLAPPDYHLLVESDVCALSNEEKVNYSRPSIDVLFESVADFYGEGACGVTLTGSNRDGARGLQAIGDQGGVCLVEDPANAEMSAMPSGALALTPSAQSLPLLEIGPALAALCQSGRR